MTPTDRFVFVQVSDPQFGMYEPGSPAFRETPLLERALASIAALDPAFVICNGDVVDIPGADDQLDAAARLLTGLDGRVPVHVVPGNHDVGDAPTPAKLAWFRRRVGPDRFSFDHGGWHFVGLNSGLIADARHVREEAEEQWEWLLGDLERAGSAPVVVFMHHPPFLETADEPDHYFNLPRHGRDRYVDLFVRRGIGTVLTGHLHRNNVVTDRGLTVVTTGPVGMPLGEAVSGLRLFTVADGALAHRYFALDDVPGQLEFAGRC